MNDHLTQSGQVRRRLRQAAEILVSDSSLRDNLTDAQAQQLLEWGTAHARETAERTARFADEDALPLIEAKVDQVRDVMRRVNRLIGSSVGPELDNAFRQLGQHVGQLLDQEDTFAYEHLVASFRRGRQAMDSEGAFLLLLSWLRQDWAAGFEEE